MKLPPPDPGFHWTSEPWGDALRCRTLDGAAQHLFTSKQLALPSPEAWQAAMTSVGAPLDRLMRVKQVHGSTVRVLAHGRVSEDAGTLRPDGDAIVSNEPGLALAVMVADCVPILIADPRRGAAAAIHAGWRGTCARVTRTAIETMRREFGTEPADLIAAIGPSAGPQDYEVGDALVEAFEKAGHGPAEISAWFKKSGTKYHLDLWAANTHQLTEAGLGADAIFRCGLSTVSHPDVFDSYRVAGDRAGRMAGLIVVPSRA